MHEAQRLHYMDNLRALAMLVGVLFHAALAYSPMLHPYWPTADAVKSVWVDVLAWFTHLFRMPVFFLVSGFFAALLVSQRGIGGMLRHRVARVLLPLLIFWPLVSVSLSWLTAQATAAALHPSPALSWLRQYTLDHGALPQAPSLAHLWFLSYLMWFALLVWVGSTLEWKRLQARIDALPAGVLVGVAPLLLAPTLVGVAAPWPAPEGFLPQLWALLSFGFYFALGYQLFRRESRLDVLKPWLPWMLAGVVLAYVAFLWLLKAQGATPTSALLRLSQAALQAYAGLWMTVSCVLAGKAWLNGHHHVLRYLADASYWVYLVHLPVLFAIQYRLLDVPGSWPMKFVVSVLGTYAFALVSYQWLVRGRALGRLLNGRMRSKPACMPSGTSERPQG